MQLQGILSTGFAKFMFIRHIRSSCLCGNLFIPFVCNKRLQSSCSHSLDLLNGICSPGIILGGRSRFQSAPIHPLIHTLFHAVVITLGNKNMRVFEIDHGEGFTFFCTATEQVPCLPWVDSEVRVGNEVLPIVCQKCVLQYYAALFVCVATSDSVGMRVQPTIQPISVRRHFERHKWARFDENPRRGDIRWPSRGQATAPHKHQKGSKESAQACNDYTHNFNRLHRLIPKAEPLQSFI